ncbi:hypothetical protein L1987_36597 [Smallanthus sonchifolius]|uniref:Uncharacterized protein n=1 Tax=Smallanthus sonchifolius TaxID=185202 RepID=A0ACB9HDL9_9ASTR|nr:hypothetical protein L1987_36597 [Smallanthus sonchifolius]
MIDVKTSEAETTALDQQKRIEDLDAQLNETEKVIVDLRAEIRNAHERLEEMKNSHMLQSNGPSENKHLIQENTDVTEHFRCYSQCSKNYNPAKEVTTSAIARNLDQNINGSEAFSTNSRVSEDQTVKTQRLPNSFRYAQSTHRLSRFYHEKLNLKEKSSKSDAKLTENNENSACTLRRSIRKKKVRYWDEISSLLKPRASLSRCKKYLVNDTKLLNDSVVEKHESAAKESDGIACDTDNNRSLKYTFSRRHKKVLSSKSDNCSSHGKSVLTRQASEKPSFNHESEKPNLIEDSSESSDNQNMIDIACQLVKAFSA